VSMEHQSKDRMDKNEVLGEKPFLLPHCPPQILHGLPWNRDGASSDEKPINNSLSHGMAPVLR